MRALTMRQRPWAASMNVNAIASPAARETYPLVILYLWRTVAKVHSASGLKDERSKGVWAACVTRPHPMHVEIAMLRTLDGHSRLEISRLLTLNRGALAEMRTLRSSCGPARLPRSLGDRRRRDQVAVTARPR